MRTGKAVFAMLLCMILCSCAIDFSESAVERARAYALQNLRGITESQRHFIEYTQPEIYENVIFPRYVVPITDLGHLKADDVKNFPTAPHLDIMHSCIVWSPPDLGAKVVVVGEGERSMRLWRPNRVLVKNYLPSDSAFLAAVQSARNYVLVNFQALSVEDQNRIRFADPEVVYTSLPVEDPDQLPKDLSSWESYLADMKEKPKEKTQISLVWPLHQSDELMVATGFSASGGMPGWTLLTAEIMKNSKLLAAKLTQEEIDAIKKPESSEKMVFPKQKKIERNPERLRTDNKNNVDGDSILYK